MRSAHRPRHAHSQLQGHQWPREAQPLGNTSMQTRPQECAPTEMLGGTCAEVWAKPQQIDTCHRQHGHTHGHPAPGPKKGVAPGSRAYAGSGGRVSGLPSRNPGSPPPPPLLPKAWASSPPPSSSLCPGPPAVGQASRQMLPAERPGSWDQGVPLAHGRELAGPCAPASLAVAGDAALPWQELSLAVAQAQGRGRGRGRVEGGTEGGGAEPGKPGPRGPQLSQRREGLGRDTGAGDPTTAPASAGSVSHHTRTPPSHSLRQARCQGPGKQWLSLGLSAREWLAGQPGVKHWLGLWCRTQRRGMSGPCDGQGGWRSGARCVPLSLHTQAAMPARAPEGATKGAPPAPPHSPIRMNPRLAASPGESTVNSGEQPPAPCPGHT